MPRSSVPKIVLRSECKPARALPVNAVSFSPDGRYLVCGGDDETITVFNSLTAERVQTINHHEWGQITCLEMMMSSSKTGSEGAFPVRLSIGTGRGRLTVVPMKAQLDPKPFGEEHAVTFAPFAFNDSVEVQAYDKEGSKLALASHSGQIKLFSIRNTSLKLLWSLSNGTAIPAGIFFYGHANEYVISVTIETAEMSCRDAINGEIVWKRSLMGGIGNAVISDDKRMLLVNNLSTGNFDVYQMPEATGVQSLPILSRLRFSKQCRFVPGTDLVICGSDVNSVNVVDISSNRVVEVLVAGKGKDMIQSVAVTHKGTPRILIAGASGGTVYVWERLTASNDVFPLTTGGRDHPELQTSAIRNEHLLLGVIVLTYSSWAPIATSVLSFVGERIGNVVSHTKEYWRS